MGKALRVFVILLLLLSITALVFAILLFQKRELLKGRTQTLENYVIKLSSTFESAAGEKGDLPGDPERDVSPVSPEVLANPERAKFWDTYRYELEKTENALLDLSRKRPELMQYYKIDPITMKVMRDPTYGTKVTEGEGTMKNLLEDVVKKASEQYDRLNQTREQLRKLREELIATINDLNSQKGDLRTRLAKIVELQQQIAGLERQIGELKDQIARLEDEKKSLQDTVGERERQIAQLEKDKAEQEIAIRRLEEEIRILRSTPRDPGAAATSIKYLEPGDKGSVIGINSEWNFVVLKVSESFVTELVGEKHDEPLPVVELNLKRAEDGKKFVTKVRLVQLKAEEGLAVADIMSEWLQMPVQAGDILFY